MEAHWHGDAVVAVCDDTRSDSLSDGGPDVIKFTDSDCESIVEQLDTPRKDKQKKLTKSPSRDVHGPCQREKDIILNSDQKFEFSAAIMKNGDHDTNGRISAFSVVKHAKKKSKTTRNAGIVQSNSNNDHKLQKHLNVAPTGKTPGRVSELSSNGKGDEVIRHHGNSDLVDSRNEASGVLTDHGVQGHDKTDNTIKVTLNISNLESPDEGEDPGMRLSRSSTNSSSSSLRDQSSQTCREAVGDTLQYPVSPRVSPATIARYSPRRVSSAELHRTPEQMVKQADRLIERTQAILERSAEAKRRTEVLLKASRERRAQERLEELASYKGERRSNLEDPNGNNEHRSQSNLDTNGNQENIGNEEGNSNPITAL